MKTAIVLAGTTAHIELIRELKNRSYYTVLIDYLSNPPAKRFADIHLQESSLDKEKVYEIAEEYHASMVIATSVDQANSTACYVLERMGLHRPYSYQTSLDVTNKWRMKSIMKENGIPTARFQIISSPYDNLDIPLPVVVKPVDSYGSRGVRRVLSKKELPGCITEAISISKTGEAIVEEFISGIEAGVYAYVLHGKVHIILTSHRYTYESKDLDEIPCFASSHPLVISPALEEKLQEICDKSAEAFALDNTPLFLQVIIIGNDIYVLELMPRLGGGQSAKLIKSMTGFDIISAAVDSFAGVKPEIHFRKPEKIYVSNNVYTSSGVLGDFLNVEQLIDRKVIDEFSLIRSLGTKMPGDLTTGSRACNFWVNGDDWNSVLSRIEETIQTLDVVDIYGNSIMRKDIYVKE